MLDQDSFQAASAFYSQLSVKFISSIEQMNFDSRVVVLASEQILWSLVAIVTPILAWSSG